MRARLSQALALVAVLTAAGGASAATPLPTHVYVPYFETWTTDRLTATAKKSGARHFHLAFLETLSKTSCTLAWNGKRSDAVVRHCRPEQPLRNHLNRHVQNHDACNREKYGAGYRAGRIAHLTARLKRALNAKEREDENARCAHD